MLGDTHTNLNEGKGSGSFMEPLYYSGHKEKLEAMIDLFATSVPHACPVRIDLLNLRAFSW